MKKLALPQLFSYSVIVILFVACSSEPKTRISQKNYSPNTQREFDLIEKNDLRKNSPYRSTIKSPTRPAIVIKEKTQNPIKTPAALRPGLETTDISRLSAKNQERLQEINQNLAFFCMKHRKDKGFQNEDQCQSFTKNVLMICEKKHKLINTIMVNCIKERLKKRY